MVIEIQVKLYSISQALTFLEGLGAKKHSGTWLREQMKKLNLELYLVGHSSFVTETDLYKISRIKPVKPGPKKQNKVNPA
jgi:hypothetical protein